QAEDGIRYRNVTGVQTCALPIYHPTVKQYLFACSYLYLQASTTGHHDVMTVPMTHSIAVQTNDGPTDCHHQILYPDQTVDQVKSAFENGSVPHHVMRIERL